MTAGRTPPSANVALLIDADNASAAALDPVLTVLAELGTVNVRRAYGNWAKPALKSWAAMTHAYALEPRQQFDLLKGKNATDMCMTIDAMDLLYGGRVAGFGLMTSDSDFMPLAMRIRQDGLPVYGFGTTRTGDAFRQACTRFIDVGALAASDAAPDIAAPVDTAKPAPAPAPVDDSVVKLLGAAWKSARRDDKGYARLTEIGQLAGNRSSFDARNYGFQRLSELVATLPEFVTERRADGLYAKRVR